VVFGEGGVGSGRVGRRSGRGIGKNQKNEGVEKGKEQPLSGG